MEEATLVSRASIGRRAIRHVLVAAGLIALSLFAVPGSAFAAAPGNDNIGDATTISGATGTISGTTVQATAETDEIDLGGVSVWYAWTAPSTGSFTFDTEGSDDLTDNLDSLMLVTTETVFPVGEINWNDDSPTNGCCDSQLAFDATSGTVYYIGVGGCCGDSAGSEGAFDLYWNPRPTNDDVSTPETISGGSGTTTGTSMGAFDDAEPGGGPGVWWTWTAPASGLIAFDTNGSSYDTYLDVQIYSSGVWQEVANNNDSSGTCTGGSDCWSQVTFGAVNTAVYRLVVSAGAMDEAGLSQWQAGSITLNWGAGTDNTAPDTTITSAKPGKNSATLTFTGSDDVSTPNQLTFECAVDSGSFSACSSPYVFSPVTGGLHTFSVRAKDQANNVDANPATASVRVRGPHK